MQKKTIRDNCLDRRIRLMFFPCAAASRCRREKRSAFDFKFTAMSIITQEEAMFVPPVMS